mmetsp:Transcript_118319/g.346613  ORF Transcript_118319/g.346613 Transcript_118319/m.346613 type:complete len:286 (-) Transcript_118319:314-1171(-)
MPMMTSTALLRRATSSSGLDAFSISLAAAKASWASPKLRCAFTIVFNAATCCRASPISFESFAARRAVSKASAAPPPWTRCAAATAFREATSPLLSPTSRHRSCASSALSMASWACAALVCAEDMMRNMSALLRLSPSSWYSPSASFAAFRARGAWPSARTVLASASVAAAWPLLPPAFLADASAFSTRRWASLGQLFLESTSASASSSSASAAPEEGEAPASPRRRSASCWASFSAYMELSSSRCALISRRVASASFSLSCRPRAIFRTSWMSFNAASFWRSSR